MLSLYIHLIRSWSPMCTISSNIYPFLTQFISLFSTWRFSPQPNQTYQSRLYNSHWLLIIVTSVFSNIYVVVWIILLVCLIIFQKISPDVNINAIRVNLMYSLYSYLNLTATWGPVHFIISLIIQMLVFSVKYLHICFVHNKII